ncbi:transketolase C-terminal domain-containing protein [Sphingomonas sp. LR61]|uniref:transketolase family protein n=1 Tax=Sphingomonas sp. LR61 TaxID=3050234 RepID=UPI002FE11C74
MLNGASGKTHQDIEDLSVMRALPNMTVLAPADETEAAAMIRWAADHDGPVYLRLARDAVADVFDDGYEFRVGAPVLLRDGGSDADVTVVSTGVQTSRTVEAITAVEAAGHRIRHVHLPTIKPLDDDALWALLDGAAQVVTVEEHSVVGGLGDVVAAVLAGHASGTRLHKVGLADSWAESGPNDFLLDKYGLSVERVRGPHPRRPRGAESPHEHAASGRRGVDRDPGRDARSSRSPRRPRSTGRTPSTPCGAGRCTAPTPSPRRSGATA